MTELKTENPANEANSRIWFLSQLGTQTSDTTSVYTVEVAEEIAFETVYFAIANLTEQYEELRTQLFVKDNRPVIVTDDSDTQSDLSVTDISGSDDAHFSKMIWGNVHAPGEPLFRWTVAVTRRQTVIGLSASRMVCDDQNNARILLALLRQLGVDAELRPQHASRNVPLPSENLPKIIEQLSQTDPLSITAGRARPPVKGGQVDSVKIRNSEAFNSSVDSLTERTSLSRVDVIVALLATVLTRHSGTETIAVGVPSPTTGNQMGILPVPVQLDDGSMIDVASRINDRRRAYFHELTGLGELIDRTRWTRDPSRTPIYQAAVIDNTPLLEIKGRANEANVRHVRSPYEIALVGPLSAGVQGEWLLQFDPEILGHETANTIAMHLRVLLEASEAAESTPLTELPFLTASEISELEAWSDGGTPVAQGELLHSRVLLRLAEGGTSPALVDTEGTVTFGELSNLVSHICEAIRKHSPAEDSLVAVVAAKNRYQIASAIAINVAGAAYLPIDPALPDERLTFLLERGRTSLVLAESSTISAHKWPDGVQVLDVRKLAASKSSSVAPALEAAEIAADSTAYVIFTSGSTGQPKGVEIAHESAANTVVDINQRFQITNDDSVLALSALNFDLSVFDVYGILGAGGTAVLLDETESRDPQRWAECVEANGITVWNSVPALVELMISAAEKRDIDLSSLRVVMMSGDWIPVSLPDRIRAHCPKAKIVSMGGATEASIWSILFHIGHVDSSWDSIPYGKPLSGQAFRILDSWRKPVPRGVAGELYIGGIGVAKGYWRDQGKTRNAFIELPDGTRWYKTGDFGKYRSDGNIKFLGRKDSQVKVNGYRIELTEIDHNIRELAGVSDAHCLVRRDDATARIVAYVTTQDHDLGITEIREYLRSRLPAYMVPSRFVFLDSFPLTANGKIDSKSLPAPGAQDDGNPNDNISSGGKEDAIHQVWCRVLQRSQVGRDEDFFAAGGDSIAALDVVSSLRAGGLAVRPQDIFDHPTILSLADVAVPIAPESRDRLQIHVGDRIPLTPVQKWFFSLDFSRPHHFNRTAWLRAVEPIDAERLTNALRKVVARHDALRMNFMEFEGQRQQHMAEVSDDQIATAVTELDPGAAPDDVIKQVQGSFDLSSAPLIKLLIDNDSSSPKVMLTVHHLIADGISVNVLCDEIDRFYSDLSVDEATSGSGFADWAHESDNYSNFANLESELEYWREVGGNKSKIDSLESTPGRLADVNLCKAQYTGDHLSADHILECANRQRVSVRDVVLAACVATLQTWENTDAVQIDIEGHGRHDIRGKLDISRTVGWLNVIYPITVKSRRGSKLGVLRRTRRALDQVPRHGLGYGQLRFKTDLGANLDTDADVAFNFLGREVESGHSLRRDPTIAARFERSQFDPQPHKMAVTPRIVDDRLEVEFTSQESYADQQEIESLAEIFGDELHALLQECGSTKQATASNYIFHAFTQR